MTHQDASRDKRTSALSTDRRRHTRIQLLGRLYGSLPAVEVSVTVVEISLGGMAIETALELPVNTEHEFLLTLGDGSTVRLAGRVAHSHKASEDPPRYLSGIEFVDESEAD
jgi:hypothetical protein